MSTVTEIHQAAKSNSKRPILQINRLNYIRINAKILDATERKMKKYLQFASEQMNTTITNDDVIEYALNLLFDRDGAFKTWNKTSA